jgi:coenzyme F420-reducing hydrogenase beta subunit
MDKNNDLIINFTRETHLNHVEEKRVDNVIFISSDDDHIDNVIFISSDDDDIDETKESTNVNHAEKYGSYN